MAMIEVKTNIGFAGTEYRQHPIYISSIPVLGHWMNSLTARELENITRELSPRLQHGADMVLSNDKSEEEVVNIFKKYGFIEMSRGMEENGSSDKMVTKMIKN